MTEQTSGSAYHTSLRLAVLLAILAGPTAGFFYIGRGRRGLAWLALTEAALALILLATWLGRPMGFWGALSLALLVFVISWMDLLRALPVPSCRALKSRVLLGALVASLLYGQGFAMHSYVLDAIQIPGGSSMIPSLEVGDRVFISKLPHVPGRGEVIVFDFPSKPNKVFMKRIVGIPGDGVKVCGGQVSVNGQELSRQPVSGPCEYDDIDENRPGASWHKVRCAAYQERNGDQTYTTVYDEPSAAATTSCSSWTVPKDKVFVLGDNRDHSSDSRYWGFLSAENIKGRVWFIWWSSRPGFIRWSRINRLVHGRCDFTSRRAAQPRPHRAAPADSHSQYRCRAPRRAALPLACWSA